MTSTQVTAPCPLCQRSSQRVHSRYCRPLQDLPCTSFALRLQRRVRKFFCLTPGCRRRIFTERLPQVAAPWARRTDRLAQHLIAIAVALGGRAGSRLGHRLGYPVPDSSLLALLERLPQVAAPWARRTDRLAQHLIAIAVALGGRAGSRLGHRLGYPVPDSSLLALLATVSPSAIAPLTVLGVDDFAFAKRQAYGTILVDLKRQRPIALPQDREASTLAQWLEQHQGIEILSRDRSATDRSGMDQGAPHTMQVADRFHLF